MVFLMKRGYLTEMSQIEPLGLDARFGGLFPVRSKARRNT
jgi:hypothetical protein